MERGGFVYGYRCFSLKTRDVLNDAEKLFTKQQNIFLILFGWFAFLFG